MKYWFLNKILAQHDDVNLIKKFELVLKELVLVLSAALNRQKSKALSFSQVGDYRTNRNLCYLSALGLPELDLPKLSRQSLFQKSVSDSNPS